MDEASDPLNEREDIKRKFLVDMPQDFYDFWEFAKSINTQAPCGQFCLWSFENHIHCYSSDWSVVSMIVG